MLKGVEIQLPFRFYMVCKCFHHDFISMFSKVFLELIYDLSWGEFNLRRSHPRKQSKLKGTTSVCKVCPVGPRKRPPETCCVKAELLDPRLVWAPRVCCSHLLGVDLHCLELSCNRNKGLINVSNKCFCNPYSFIFLPLSFRDSVTLFNYRKLILE